MCDVPVTTVIPVTLRLECLSTGVDEWVGCTSLWCSAQQYSHAPTQPQLTRRRPGQSVLTTPRDEADRCVTTKMNQNYNLSTQENMLFRVQVFCLTLSTSIELPSYKNSVLCIISAMFIVSCAHRILSAWPICTFENRAACFASHFNCDVFPQLLSPRFHYPGSASFPAQRGVSHWGLLSGLVPFPTRPNTTFYCVLS